MNYIFVILAGGQASRMGIPGKVISKGVIPIFNTTLIRRQIRQAIDAGIKNIIVSTNKYFYSQIKILTSDLRGVCVISNPHHKEGSMNALLKIMERNNKLDRVIMGFADIYYLKNPFYKVKKLINSNDTAIFATKPFDKIELTKGGIIFSNTGYVSRIIEKPILLNAKGYRWTGLAILNYNTHTELKSFLKFHSNQSEEDFFQFLRNKERIKIEPVSDFINVNTPPQLFLASLYQALEVTSKSSVEFKLMKKFASDFRRKILINELPLLTNFE